MSFDLFADLMAVWIATFIVWRIGRFLYEKVSAGSETRTIQGKFVAEYSAVGFGVAGTLETFFSYRGSVGLGLLIGWAIGMLHGGLRLLNRQASLSSSTIQNSGQRDLENPYSAPETED